jgi:hypothetical protein
MIYFLADMVLLWVILFYCIAMVLLSSQFDMCQLIAICMPHH